MPEEKVVGYLLSEQAMEPFRPKIIHVTDNIVEFDTRLQEMDEDNRNKRAYGSNIMIPALASEFISERLATRSWYGEAGHPDTSEIKRQLKYDHSNLSHLVLNFEVEGAVISGRVQTAATRVGKDMRGLIVDNNSLVAFSSRGYGPVTNKGGRVMVAKPYTLFCYDWVVHPSHKNSYMANQEEKLVNESGIIVHNKSINDLLVPISEAELRAIIVDRSKNLSEAADQMLVNLSESYLELSPNCDAIAVQSEAGKLILGLEESVQRDIDNFMLEIF